MAIRKSSNSGIPFGNNAGRPATPQTGQPYFNGQENRLELYTQASGWQNIVQETPGVSSISGIYSEQSNSGTITITGTNFVSGAYASAVGTNGTEVIATSTTYNSIVQLTAVFNNLSNAYEPYNIKVTNPSNLFGIIPNALYINASPVWQTTAGSLGSFNELVSISLLATASDSDSTITYSLASGSSLPSGISLNSSTGAITGILPAISADTTYTFTINASDGVNIIPRTFSITSLNTITWNTASGSLGTFYELSNINLTVSATTPDSATVTYALASGSSLPTGVALNTTTGVISGTLPDISTSTTYTFTINALQGATVLPRTFSITSTAYAPVTTVEVLVVAGGGGGSHNNVDGTQSSGGGAGGLIYDTAKNVSTWIGVAKTLTIGNGGAASSDGQNSVLGDLIALKGGAGGSGGGSPGNGGSGTYGSGGGQGGSGSGGSVNNAQGTSGQGNQGGYATFGGGLDAAGGGGGAGGAGGNASGSTAGTGGIGRTISITGQSVGYAGGGGNNGDLGYGGGFNGSDANRTGKANTGGGGKGTTGPGGSGVVVIAYPISNLPISSISAGLTYTVDTSTRSGYRVYRFTAGTGTITF